MNSVIQIWKSKGLEDLLDEKRILNDLSRVINRAEEYGKFSRQKDRDKWIEKHSSKFDNVFNIAAWGRDKPPPKNEKKTETSDDLMVFIVIFINIKIEKL